MFGNMRFVADQFESLELLRTHSVVDVDCESA